MDYLCIVYILTPSHIQLQNTASNRKTCLLFVFDFVAFV